MPTVYALAASPAGQAALRLAQEEHKTKGFRAVFGVILMFGILCGGVWLLLQSSFGPKQAYYISGTAFWGCWLVLSVIWLTGVPGISALHIPKSTPQYYGPQGVEKHWVVIDPFNPKTKGKTVPVDALITIGDDVHDQTTLQDKAAAEASAQEKVSEAYAVQLGVGALDVQVPSVVVIQETKLARVSGHVRYARVTFGPAAPNATDTARQKALIARIQPKSFDLWLDPGSLPTPTYYAIGLFFLLFAVHAGLLARYELKQVPQPQGAPERITASV